MDGSLMKNALASSAEAVSAGRSGLLSAVIALLVAGALGLGHVPTAGAEEARQRAGVPIIEPTGVPQSDRWISSHGHGKITGAPGSPSATIAIDGVQLPAPPQEFRGTIERTTEGSKPYWPARIEPPAGAPNVLLIMTDDSGFGVTGTFGGVIPTPSLDRIANSGLRYTNFNSTALCSPTRAALITGRNHHSVGYGVIAEQATGFPGYDSVITGDKATIGRILKENGYRTSWFGKNHNTPAFQATAIGPFDQWPVGMGFEYFYGFMGGDTNQWQPTNG